MSSTSACLGGGASVGCLCLLLSPVGGRVACVLLLPHPTTLFPGKTLIKVSEAEKRLGAAERDFIHTASLSFLTPLRNFLEGDWKTISVRSLGPLLRGGSCRLSDQGMTVYFWVSVCQGSLSRSSLVSLSLSPCRRRGGSCRTGVLTWMPAKPG